MKVSVREKNEKGCRFSKLPLCRATFSLRPTFEKNTSRSSSVRVPEKTGFLRVLPRSSPCPRRNRENDLGQVDPGGRRRARRVRRRRGASFVKGNDDVTGRGSAKLGRGPQGGAWTGPAGPLDRALRRRRRRRRRVGRTRARHPAYAAPAVCRGPFIPAARARVSRRHRRRRRRPVTVARASSARRPHTYRRVPFRTTPPPLTTVPPAHLSLPAPERVGPVRPPADAPPPPPAGGVRGTFRARGPCAARPMCTRSATRLSVVRLKPVSRWMGTAAVPPTSPARRLVRGWRARDPARRSQPCGGDKGRGNGPKKIPPPGKPFQTKPRCDRKSYAHVCRAHDTGRETKEKKTFGRNVLENRVLARTSSAVEISSSPRK